MKKKTLASLLGALLALTALTAAASAQEAPSIRTAPGGSYEAVNAPAGSNLFLARYNSNGRFQSLEALTDAAGTGNGEAGERRIFLLDGETLHPLCESAALEPAPEAARYALVERIYCWLDGVAYSDYLGSPDPEAGANGIPGSGNNFQGGRACLILADGSTRTVNLDRTYLQDGGGLNGKTLAIRAGTVVRYDVTSDGDFRLIDDNGKRVQSVQSSILSLDDRFLSGLRFPACDEDGSIIGSSPARGDSNTIVAARRSEDEPFQTGDLSDFLISGGRAYARIVDGVARIIYVLDCDHLTDLRDVSFITGASVSKVVLETDGRKYFTYDAVVHGEIVLIMIDAEIEGKLDGNGHLLYDHNNVQGKAFTIGKPTPPEDGAVMVINNYINDADDLITALNYTGSIAVGYDQGIKRVSGSTSEIKVGANGTYYGKTLNLASNCKFFLADNYGCIEAVQLNDICTSKINWAYWVQDDGLVTSLFVIEVPDRD